MKKMFEAVKAFHRKFGYEYSNTPVVKTKLKDARYKLMKEENKEYDKADDMNSIVDAVGDQLYVLFGTIISHGLEDLIEEAFMEIHRSNMSKSISGQNKPFKGPNYSEPDLDPIIRKYHSCKDSDCCNVGICKLYRKLLKNSVPKVDRRWDHWPRRS